MFIVKVNTDFIQLGCHLFLWQRRVWLLPGYIFPFSRMISVAVWLKACRQILKRSWQVVLAAADLPQASRVWIQRRLLQDGQKLKPINANMRELDVVSTLRFWCRGERRVAKQWNRFFWSSFAKQIFNNAWSHVIQPVVFIVLLLPTVTQTILLLRASECRLVFLNTSTISGKTTRALSGIHSSDCFL